MSIARRTFCANLQSMSKAFKFENPAKLTIKRVMESKVTANILSTSNVSFTRAKAYPIQEIEGSRSFVERSPL